MGFGNVALSDTAAAGAADAPQPERAKLETEMKILLTGEESFPLMSKRLFPISS